MTVLIFLVEARSKMNLSSRDARHHIPFRTPPSMIMFATLISSVVCHSRWVCLHRELVARPSCRAGFLIVVRKIVG